MATLPSIFPEGNFFSGAWTVTGAGSFVGERIDEPISSPDDTNYISGPSGAAGTAVIGLTDMPADFVSMDTLAIQARHRWVGRVDDALNLECRIMSSSGGVLAAADSAGGWRTITVSTNFTTSFADSLVRSFSYLATGASKADWDNARLEIRQTYTASMANDNARIEISAVEITGTYVPQPNPPANVSATGDADSILVDWDAPASGTAPDNYNVYRGGANLLTGNDATFDTGVGNWVNETGFTLSHNVDALRLTATGETSRAILVGPAIPGRTYKASGFVRNVQGARSAYIGLYFYDSGGSLITASTSATPTDSSTYVEHSVEAVALANAASWKILLFGITGTRVVGDIHEWDNVSLTEVQKLTPVEQITGDNANFTNGVGDWTTTSVFNISATSGVLRAETTGTAVPGRSILGPSVAVTPGQVVNYSIDARMVVGSRPASMDIQGRDSQGAHVDVMASLVTVNTASFTTRSGSFTVPAGVATVRFRVGAAVTGSVGDVVEFDNASLSFPVGTATQFDDATAVEGITYTYFVRSVAGGLESTDSNSASAALSTGPPATQIESSDTGTASETQNASIPVDKASSDSATVSENHNLSMVAGPQRLSPVSDGVIVGVWTNESGGVLNLYQSIDEISPGSTTDYVQSPVAATAADLYRAIFDAGQSPDVLTDHYLRVRHGKDATGGQTIALDLFLREADGTIVASRSLSTADMETTDRTDNFLLTESEAGSISDYSALRVEFNPIAGGGQKRSYRVYWAQLEVPAASTNQNKGSFDSGTATETVTNRVLTNEFYTTDIEEQLLSVAHLSTETATSNEAESAVSVSLLDTDSAAATETEVLATAIASSDVGSAPTETRALLQASSSSDSGLGDEGSAAIALSSSENFSAIGGDDADFEGGIGNWTHRYAAPNQSITHAPGEGYLGSGALRLEVLSAQPSLAGMKLPTPVLSKARQRFFISFRAKRVSGSTAIQMGLLVGAASTVSARGITTSWATYTGTLELSSTITEGLVVNLTITFNGTPAAGEVVLLDSFEFRPLAVDFVGERGLTSVDSAAATDNQNSSASFVDLDAASSIESQVLESYLVPSGDTAASTETQSVDLAQEFISSSDSAASSESSVASVAAASLDSATVTETASVGVAQSDTDAGVGVEASEVFRTASSTDTGSASEDQTFTYAFGSTDTGSVTEQIVARDVSDTDTSTAVEAQSIYQSEGESALSSETELVQRVSASSDAGASTEALGAISLSGISESGISAEVTAVVVAVAHADTGASQEALVDLDSVLLSEDQFAVSEGATLSTENELISSDIAAGSEAASLASGLTHADTAGASEGVQIALGASDTATSAENASQSATAASAEASTATEQAHVSVAGQIDSGLALEGESVAATAASIDTASVLSEIVTSIAVGGQSETAIATEGQAIGIALVSTDSAIGTEVENASALHSLQDTAADQELQTVSVVVASTDVGAGVDGGAAEYLFASSDSGVGTDSFLAVAKTSGDLGTATETHLRTSGGVEGDLGLAIEGQDVARTSSSSDAAIAVEASLVVALTTPPAESGSSAEASALEAGLGSEDNATSTETYQDSTAEVFDFEFGATLEVAYLSTEDVTTSSDAAGSVESQSLVVQYADTDAGTGSDGQAGQVFKLGTDAGAVSEIHAVAASQSSSDIGAAIEGAATASQQYVGSADSGIGADTQVIAVPAVSSESGGISETTSLAVERSSTESGAASENRQVSAVIAAAETVVATELESVVRTWLLGEHAIADEDQVVSVGLLPAAEAGVASESQNVLVVVVSTDVGVSTETQVIPQFLVQLPEYAEVLIFDQSVTSTPFGGTMVVVRLLSDSATVRYEAKDAMRTFLIDNSFESQLAGAD